MPVVAGAVILGGIACCCAYLRIDPRRAWFATEGTINGLAAVITQPGRLVHVNDMVAKLDNRATCTALSNSVVCLILLGGGVFGVIAQWLGIGTVLALFASMAAIAIMAASRLDEVQTMPVDKGTQ